MTLESEITISFGLPTSCLAGFSSSEDNQSDDGMPWQKMAHSLHCKGYAESNKLE
jgi:hypothetical protein